MNKILYINSSPSGADSQSVKVANALLKKLPPGDVTTRNLDEDVPPFVSKAYIHVVYTDPTQRTAAQKALLRYSDTVIAEVREADIIVIGTPVHNFAIPALLKAWIDQLVRPGATCGKGGRGFEQKKVYVAVASGRLINPEGFVGPYLKAILAEVGLTDITVLTLKGTLQKEIRQEDVDHLIKEIQ
ncbi:FMN-dependent NADH-azoreductase [Dinghuibacter silviterrae]|uniref:FMN dependent NADH:quinone oxidoreductase n=1 Tax=Dinghuibacter silviterrae TaxID=1539049 RepID=A0A4R8DYP4_9BACT|nr:NAD(P)H-dependent oxidoreductase [Dinghuibacter silviterrae]TDX02331.1 FMN-dependent NADH-azoreductase [Dinghuibacter silviterrae]